MRRYKSFRCRRLKTSKPLDLDGCTGLLGVEADFARPRGVAHAPGAIQPHGALLAVDPHRDMLMVCASRNLTELLGDASLADGIGRRSLGDVLGDDFAAAVRDHFGEGRPDGEAHWHAALKLSGQPGGFDATVHAQAGLVLVELERAGPGDEADALAAMRQLHGALVDLRGTGPNLAQLVQVAVRSVRRLTGYDRVVLYRFDADGNGEALAEDKVADWDQSLRGLRFPASDVPRQTRELLRRNELRWVPDFDAAPTPLDADPAWAANRQAGGVDLSFAHLRAPLPTDLRRCRSMGVRGSLILPIVHEERLWGLAACHHRRPHRPSPGQRAAAAALTDAFALRIGPAERAATEQARQGDLARAAALLAHMAQAELVIPALTAGDVTVASLFDAAGAAVVYDGAISLLGQTPPSAELRKLTGWLQTQGGAARLFQTDNLAAAFPPWEPHTAIASGVLAVFLSADRSDMLLWFRPEEPQLVNWGGSVRQRTVEELARLSDRAPAGGWEPQSPRGGPDTQGPRHGSGPLFERWVETRHGAARPWAPWELEIAESLRHGITEVVVRGLRRVSDLHDKVRQSQKMEVVGQLTGGIAHDFNNLLTGITGSLELMRTRTAQGRFSDLDRYIRTALTSADRGASLIHRLLAFSRRQTLDPKVVDANRLATSMEELIRHTVGPSIQVETVTSGGLWRTLCDVTQLENALLNLALNARDAMPSGGRLTIVASNAYLDEAHASRHEVAPGQYVAISVADTGAGMPPEVVARVFEPFFTTKPLGQGTGLGLSMVYGFAKQSNGYTRVYSKVGRGTTVRLYLPRHHGDEADASSVDPPQGRANAVETVLVVDDEPVLRVLIADMLRDLGYEVIEAASGAEGLRILRSVQDIDLMISDVSSPGGSSGTLAGAPSGGLSGRRLADAAQAQRPGLKVLLIAGPAEGALLGGGAPEPGTQVLTKPFAMEVLAAKVQTML